MKIFQRIQSAVAGKLILGALLAAFAFTAATQAQPAFSGKFVLPQEVRWNHAVLPAGEYSIEMDSLSAPAVLRSKATNQSYRTATPMFAQCESSVTQLNIAVRGHDRSVRSLDIPEIHQTLIFQAPTKAEREALAKAGTSEAVAMEIARK